MRAIMRTVSTCGHRIPTLSGMMPLVITKNPSSARARPLRTEAPIAPTAAMPQNHLECVSDDKKFHMLPSSVEIGLAQEDKKAPFCFKLGTTNSSSLSMLLILPKCA